MTHDSARLWPALVVAAVACGGTSSNAPTASSAPPFTFSGGNGSDCRQRVIIGGTTDLFVGIIAEYRWLALHHPGYRILQQALTYCDEAKTDIVMISRPHGSNMTFYFDVSALARTPARQRPPSRQQPAASRKLRPIDSSP